MEVLASSEESEEDEPLLGVTAHPSRKTNAENGVSMCEDALWPTPNLLSLERPIILPGSRRDGCGEPKGELFADRDRGCLTNDSTGGETG